MSEQEYLSPRKLLSYLCDLEDKVPRINNNAYIPLKKNVFTRNSDLQKEAKNMLEYVGLNECIPKCKFDVTPKDVAGFTHNTMSIYEIDITVSENYINNPNACKAILAHEICHKLIFLNGINFVPPIPQYFNEIFTDLCTIYIGFGELILKGYINEGDNTLKMGYLPPDMYRQTFAMVSKTTNVYSPLDLNLHDPVLEDAINIWQTPETAKKQLRESFMNDEREISRLNRDIMLLHQILDQVYHKHGETFRILSSKAERIGIFGSHFKSNSVFKAFSSIYEHLLTGETEKNDKINRSQEEISSLILTLSDEYNIDFGALNYENIKCPNCNKISKTTISDRDTIIKCTSCGIYFRLTNSLINIAVLRKIRNKVINDRNRDFILLKEKEENLNKRISTINDREKEISNELNEAYRKGINKASKDANKNYQEILNKLPKWLKLLIFKRLPSNII